MGKTKQNKEKKFDRNVEISAPILDPEVIKAIHTPPKGRKLDVRHGGFKALLSDLNSQDSTDEMSQMSDSHVPSYIGISCAVSGYSNYSSYIKKSSDNVANNFKVAKKVNSAPNRSQANSPNGAKYDQIPVHHITIDKSAISSVDEERKELTEKITASATERRRSPSPITPTEDDRHHGAYVGARYCPMPPPANLVNKHIPLLGIDDDMNPDEIIVEDPNKVENKIASLYGDTFVEDWRESMSHKSKKEHNEEQKVDETTKNLKDLVTLKPAPKKPAHANELLEPVADVPAPNVKVLGNVDKQFLNKLLTDNNPPMPKSPSPQTMSPVFYKRATPEVQSIDTKTNDSKDRSFILSSETPSPHKDLVDEEYKQQSPVQPHHGSVLPEVTDQVAEPYDEHLYSPTVSPNDQRETSTLDATKMAPSPPSHPIVNTEDLLGFNDHEENERNSVEHLIEYKIRTESPLDNQSSPVKVIGGDDLAPSENQPREHEQSEKSASITPDIYSGSPHEDFVASYADNSSKQESHHVVTDDALESINDQTQLLSNNSNNLQIQPDATSFVEPKTEELEKADSHPIETITGESDGDNKQDGHYFLKVLNQDISFISERVREAENLLSERESGMNEESVGRLRSAIGKANLLINKKCNQFKELCEQSLSEDSSSQYAVLNDDLAGFWDMLSIQINDVRKSFDSLNL